MILIKKTIWYTILTLASVSVIVLTIGFVQAIRVTINDNSQPAAQALAATSPTAQASTKQSSKNANSLNMLILGDSIAKGTGDEKGKGFAGDLPDAFKNSTSKDIQVNDAGIDGLESQGFLEELKSKRLDQSIAGSDIILVSIGGNDLRTLLTMNSLAQEDAFKGKLDGYMSNLKQSLKLLRTTNPNSTIIFLGLYNPFEKATGAEDQRFLEEWNYNSQQLIESDSKAIFIPTYDLMKYNLARYLAKDGLHPNAAGYQALSGRISQSVGVIISGS